LVSLISQPEHCAHLAQLLIEHVPQPCCFERKGFSPGNYASILFKNSFPASKATLSGLKRALKIYPRSLADNIGSITLWCNIRISEMKIQAEAQSKG